MAAKRKQITKQAIIGERGVNLIQRIVLEMGCAWHPTNQSVEAGIDGEIELVHPQSREATNTVVRVQSRATLRRFTKETDDGFEYVCEERDLEYWLSGNVPVILVVSRPHTGEAYWVPVKEYFSAAVARKDLRVRFDKRTMRFTIDVLPTLFQLAVPRSRGLYFAPMPRTETLYTNLLIVSRLPERLWLADTNLRHRREVLDRLRGLDVRAPEFVLKNKKILSAHDLSTEPWRRMVDLGTVEEFETSDLDATDHDTGHLLVELLNRCLTTRARQMGVARRLDDDGLFFSATGDLSPRKVPFRSVKEPAARTVFQGYPYTRGPRLGEIAYYRHAACATQFRKYDGQWYLEILPTYHFTSDGQRRHPFSDKYLSGIKRQEKQGAVLYQVVMWASLLRGAQEDDAAAVARNTYRFLGFGPLQTFELGVGIEDRSWLPNEDKETEKAGYETLDDLPLFKGLDQRNPSIGAGDTKQ